MQSVNNTWRTLGAGVWVGMFTFVSGCHRTPPAETTRVELSAWTSEGFNGRRIRTEHFDIISTVPDAAFEEGLALFLETAYEQYESLLPATDGPAERLTTYVFGLRNEWTRFTRARFPLRSEVYARIRSGGFTEGTTSVSFYVNRSVTLATLAHEGWHQYVNARLDRPIPAWLNEGLACTFESFDVIDDRPRFAPRRNAFRINSLRTAIQRRALLPLSKIVDTDAGEVILSDRTIMTDTYYAQAWALISFLRYGSGRRHARSFERMMNDLSAGTFHTRVSAAGVTESAAGGASPMTLGRAAFVAYFGTTPETLQESYYDHLIRLAGY